MCFNQRGDISTWNGSSLKLVDKFTYLGCSVSSTETSRYGQLLIAYRSYGSQTLTDKMKRSFFQAAVMSLLLYGCTTWMLTKHMEKKLDGNYTRMPQAILKKSWRQQLYGHLPNYQSEMNQTCGTLLEK